MRYQIYVCPHCHSTKTLQAEHHQSTREFEEDLPDYLYCDVCFGRGRAGQEMHP
jgi:phage terminase large subunit GpA-like protein